jgi:hypothetical protein
MWRGALAIVAGVVVWIAAFMALAMLLGGFWPAYAAHAISLNES